MDAAWDRVHDRARTSMQTAIEGARLGRVFASDAKAYRKWRSAWDQAAPTAHKPVGLTGGGLEAHVATLRRSRPDLVAVRA